MVDNQMIKGLSVFDKIWNPDFESGTKLNPIQYAGWVLGMDTDAGPSQSLYIPGMKTLAIVI